METFSLDKITLTPLLDTRRKKANDLYPVKYRVTYMRKQVYYPSGINLTLKEWDKLPTAKGKDLKEQRELIKAGNDKIVNHIKELVKGETGFTIDQLNTRLSRGLKNSIITAFYDRVESLKKQGKLGTADWYFYSAKAIQRFNNRDLKFSEITIEWLKKFEVFLLEEDRSFTTISMYMRALQALMNEGKKQGIITPVQYPFGKGRYEIPEEEGRKMALTLLQIGAVLKYKLYSDSEKRCRDMWFFCYLCNGINITDLLHLRYSNLVNDEVHFYRQKTISRSKKKKEVVAVLLPEMNQIIRKWGTPHQNDNFVFPFLSDGLTPENERRIVKNVTRLINKKMTQIGKALGIGSISTYSARHSFATVQKRSGVSIAYISESLGHSDIKTTENYLDSFEGEERLRNASYLTKFEPATNKTQ